MASAHPTRRHVAQGVAWSVPVVVVASAAPAMAASPPAPSISRSFLVGRTGSGCFLRDRITVTTDDSATYYRIINATSTTTVTGVTASVLVQKSAGQLTWTSNSTSWGAPTIERNAQNQPVIYTVNGVDYYRYVSALVGTVPAPVNGTITLPRVSWDSSCSSNISQGLWVNGRGTATINGTQQIQLGAYRQI